MARDRQRRLKPHEYRCAACKGVFVKGWSDEAAEAEWDEHFPDLPMDDEVSVVCDNCYEAMLQDMRDKPWKYADLPPHPGLK